MLKYKKIQYIVIIFLVILFFSIFSHIYNKRATKTIEYITYTVIQGDTLWKIASQYRVCKDIREDIYNIQKINHCNTNLIPGQTLTIPIKK